MRKARAADEAAAIADAAGFPQASARAAGIVEQPGGTRGSQEPHGTATRFYGRGFGLDRKIGSEPASASAPVGTEEPDAGFGRIGFRKESVGSSAAAVPDETDISFG